MRAPRTSAGLLALASFLAGTAARAECTKDLDCSGEQICEEGRCAEPAPTPPAPAPAAAAPAQPVGPPRVIVLESAPVVEAPRFERRSPALIVVGSLAIVGGVGGLLVGLGSMGSTCHYELADHFTVQHCESSPNYLAYALGGGALVGGTVLIVLGAKRVKVEPVASVSPWLSPQAAGLSLRLKL